ncbi:wall-associated receptor kinase-like 1 [Telopea speciosissima]|uniref:wall-associated receptor kinase-like 1 n=1 Tax=Telopea speciosissima TaxID=54955 RepID=UPI001CC594F0|nr:wall-associated receptor kinase-like 1 [Telopea speciosissima]
MWFSYWAIQERRRTRLFKKNGGILLKQQIRRHQERSKKGVPEVKEESKTGIKEENSAEKGERKGLSQKEMKEENFKFFTIKELKNATNNFRQPPLREGEFGKVYEGNLQGGKQVIVIQRPKNMDERQIIQFVNEVDILSHSNHEHVVKLLGCCLDNKDPLLVYESFSISLFDRIHHKLNDAAEQPLSWIDRLRIATETANALDYLHSSFSLPIFHRNLKSSTILLDNNKKVKVSDYGALGFGREKKDESEKKIQGNHAYFDPECDKYSDCHLTDKSDVYSFGVVLAELLTGKKPILSEEPGKMETLAEYFVREVTNENLCPDERIKNDAEKDHFLIVVELTKNCLQDKGEARPTMKEVVNTLGSLLSLLQPKQEQQQTEHRDVSGPSTSSILDATADEIEADH